MVTLINPHNNINFGKDIFIKNIHIWLIDSGEIALLETSPG